jgi:hypothetical protein
MRARASREAARPIFASRTSPIRPRSLGNQTGSDRTPALSIQMARSEQTELMLKIRKVLRSELSLPIVETRFTKEQISQSFDHINKSRPDLWEAWKVYEKNGQTFQEIRGALEALLKEMKITTYSTQMTDLITAIRHVVLVDVGVWKPDEI